MTTFYLIRHGEPDWDFIQGRGITGALRDFVPLTQKGISQAEQIVNSVKDILEADLIISSPYTRALQTAATMNINLRLSIQVEFDLYEWNADNWTSKSVEELNALSKDYIEHGGYCPPGENKIWETKESIQNRTLSVLRKYTDHSKVLVVCHGMVISTLMNCSSEEIGFCSVHEFRLGQYSNCCNDDDLILYLSKKLH